MKVNSLSSLFTNYICFQQKEFEDDFLKNPTANEFIHHLQKWRDRYEQMLDARPRYHSLDFMSHYLTEFQYNKVDVIEVFGQYTEVF